MTNGVGTIVPVLTVLRNRIVGGGPVQNLEDGIPGFKLFVRLDYDGFILRKGEVVIPSNVCQSFQYPVLAKPDRACDAHVGVKRFLGFVAPSADTSHRDLDVDSFYMGYIKSLLRADDRVNSSIVGVTEPRDVVCKPLINARGWVSRFGHPAEFWPNNILLAVKLVDVLHVAHNRNIIKIGLFFCVGVLRFRFFESSDVTFRDDVIVRDRFDFLLNIRIQRCGMSGQCGYREGSRGRCHNRESEKCKETVHCCCSGFLFWKSFVLL
mmetsp:Transcript_54/g.118  ORF Transcript_54/g.118 Transcript_54/m.118 type:complete len:266 (-) Transcript_54:68-865(-)